MTQLIDLSHRIRDGLVTYPGLPAPRVSSLYTHAESEEHYAPGTGFHIGRIDCVANTGTYLDTPFHRFEHGVDLAGLPLESVANLPGICIRVDPETREVGPEILPEASLQGHAVLFATGWSRFWDTPRYFEDYPYLSGELGAELRRREIALAGIDSLNIDDNRDGRRPVHTHLLEAGIPVVEHMTRLEQLPERGFRFFSVPVKIEGMGTFPVRAFALLGS